MGLAIPPFIVTNPRSMVPAESTVNTFVVPKYRGNVSPALKKKTLTGTPIGMFESVNGKSGDPTKGAVSVSLMMAPVLALTTLIIVPDTLPVIVTDPEAGGGGVVVPPPSDPPPLQEARPSTKMAQATNLHND